MSDDSCFAFWALFSFIPSGYTLEEKKGFTYACMMSNFIKLDQDFKWTVVVRRADMVSAWPVTERKWGHFQEGTACQLGLTSAASGTKWNKWALGTNEKTDNGDKAAIWNNERWELLQRSRFVSLNESGAGAEEGLCLYEYLITDPRTLTYCSSKVGFSSNQRLNILNYFLSTPFCLLCLSWKSHISWDQIKGWSSALIYLWQMKSRHFLRH